MVWATLLLIMLGVLYSWIYFKTLFRDISDETLCTEMVNNFCILYREALKRAKLLLSMKHGLARLDNVWGVGGGQRPVMYLINKVVNNFVFFCSHIVILLCR